VASFSSTKSEASVSPKVEVSPSDHGTLPLTSFVPEKKGNNNDAVAMSMPKEVDDRLVEKLRQAIGTTARPTPIQAHAIPLLLDGHDIMASSPTGSGKSIMFGLPLLQRLVLSHQQSNGGGNMGAPRALVISPTRELAAQTASVLKSFVVPRNSKSGSSSVSLNVCLATGGSDLRNQRQQLPSCDVLVGTPGRILQFSDERKLSLGSIEYLVVDEADRLLDMGFEPQLTRIARSLGRRKGGTSQQQSVLCSATFPLGVQRLASDFLRPDYYFVSVGRVGSTHSNIRQRFEWTNAFYGNQRNRNNNNISNTNNGNNNRNFDPKEDAVVRNVQRFWEESNEAKTKQPNVIVFTNTKDRAEQYGKALSKLGNRFKTDNSKSSSSCAVRVIHGDK
jgi:superfamily II DNA/RNA helicase